MHLLSLILIALYAFGLTAIFVYTIAQVHLVYHYLKGTSRKKPKVNWSEKSSEAFPMVTVQLPIYNERYVVDRLLDAVTNFNWPKEKLQIQVLDDSTDDTVDIIAEKVQKLQEHGYQIQHVKRPTREGYKAGALQYGLKRAKGEYIAIFDADFMPQPDFLRQTLPWFEDKNMGMVQARWGHLNQQYSLLTKLQAFALNAHFTVEQKGRNNAGYFMNFNGTAGVWRKACIRDAGGWQHDTLTEDLDLSYRAQMRGWDFYFTEEVVSPAELPVVVSALKAQQFRWTKGAAEAARKHFSRVWNLDMPLIKKLHASSHLLSSSVFLFILLISVLSVPLLWFQSQEPGLAIFFKLAGFFLIGLLGWLLFYGTSFMIQENGSTLAKAGRLIYMFPLFLSISMGLSLHNTIAVLKGYARRTTPFVRTPKFNIIGLSDRWSDKKYLITKLSAADITEGLLTVYFLGGIITAFLLQDYSMLPFHLMLFVGFGTIFGHSLYEKTLTTTK
ncbi:MAG TPA: cellulose synthase family protein [Balneolaceae bacterium]|nr:cellulose synthase family protein [Balneolaceae bacterium]